jgi:ferredoxin-type protein NapF
MERRELFSSLASSVKKQNKQELVIRPPYYNESSDFLKECINCEGFCATFCEEHIIIIQEDSTPKLDFSKNGCTYCDECAINCPSSVLSLENKGNIKAIISIDILTCLSWHNTMCFSCKDPCDDEAIDFLAMFRPQINDNCTSCGFCVSVCPTNAIKIKVM